MHIPQLPPFQPKLVRIRRVHHVLPHAKDAHRPHRFVNNVPPMRVGRLVVVGRDPRLARVGRQAPPRVRRPFESRARRAPRHPILGRGVAPEIHVGVTGGLDGGPSIPAGLGDDEPILLLDVRERLGGVEEPRVGGGGDGVDGPDGHGGRVVMDLRADHERARGGDELRVGRAVDHVDIGAAVLDFQGLGEDGLGGRHFHVILNVCPLRTCEGGDWVQTSSLLGGDVGVRRGQEGSAIAFARSR